QPNRRFLSLNRKTRTNPPEEPCNSRIVGAFFGLPGQSLFSPLHRLIVPHSKPSRNRHVLSEKHDQLLRFEGLPLGHCSGATSRVSPLLGASRSPPEPSLELQPRLLNEAGRGVFRPHDM